MHIIENVKRFFHGVEGYNCAQAVIKIHDHTDTLEHVISELNSKGGGRAPEGMCGALYGALEMADDDKKQYIKDEFIKQNGAETCRELKRVHKTPCAQCVESACRLLEETEEKG
jgi:bacterioferritin-associated ferredoxin